MHRVSGTTSSPATRSGTREIDEPEQAAQSLLAVGESSPLRPFVAAHAGSTHLSRADPASWSSLNEIVSNVLDHASGRGVLRLWQDAKA